MRSGLVRKMMKIEKTGTQQISLSSCHASAPSILARIRTNFSRMTSGERKDSASSTIHLCLYRSLCFDIISFGEYYPKKWKLVPTSISNFTLPIFRKHSFLLRAIPRSKKKAWMWRTWILSKRPYCWRHYVGLIWPLLLKKKKCRDRVIHGPCVHPSSSSILPASIDLQWTGESLCSFPLLWEEATSVFFPLFFGDPLSRSGFPRVPSPTSQAI